MLSFFDAEIRPLALYPYCTVQLNVQLPFHNSDVILRDLSVIITSAFKLISVQKEVVYS